MGRQNILVDLSLGHRKVGFSGIPQDSRLIFDGLVKSAALKVDGLVWSNHRDWNGRRLTGIESQSLFLGVHLERSKSSLVAEVLSVINYSIGNALRRLTLSGNQKNQLYDLVSDQLKEIIWRQFFASTLDPSRRDEISRQKYKLSSLGLASVSFGAIHNFAAPMMDTTNYDFVIFQDSRKIKVSPNTQKVIRYHDGIPVFSSDTMREQNAIKLHFRSIEACANDSLFVCNSTSAREDLARLVPQAGERATVIPYFVPAMKRQRVSRDQFEDIATARISDSAKKTGKKDIRQRLALVKTWLGASEGSEEKSIPNFIMTLSTIEPRKNIPALVTAWLQLRNQFKDLRMLVVGKPGWKYDDTIAAMEPYVERGLLLHLEGIAQHELPYLYSAAKCFVFPSFAEGFGLPPVEAMQCGCPVVVSDIPAHRYMAGDAALYIDPYDHISIRDKIAAVLEDPGLAEQLRENGLKNAQRFTSDAVLPQWENFFEEHQKKDRTKQ